MNIPTENKPMLGAMQKRAKFRPQRGGYAESMVDVVEIEGINDLAEYLSVIMKVNIFVAALNFESIGVDERNGWDTYLVRFGGLAVGFCDKNLSVDK